MNSPRITGVRPLWGVEGGWLTLAGSNFPLEPLPEVRIGAAPARLLTASSRELRVSVPAGLDGGRMPVRIESMPGETVYVDVGAPIVTGVHQVDSPVFDASGNLFVTFSGSRGQQAPVSLYVVRPDGSREPFVSNLPNPTSLAFDPSGALHVSSRFDGSVYRIAPDGAATLVATDLGVACGIAFDAGGVLHVGDRSGSILRVEDGRSSVFATLPPSVAAFHLAFAPDGALFVTAPTLGTRDRVYRISPEGLVEVFFEGFGRPQGLAFGPDGSLYVVDALAGAGGLFRFPPGSAAPELLLAAGGLVGVAFASDGSLAVASAETVFRFQPAADQKLHVVGTPA
ncbi:MAG TPA: IPT/TIG domain-containing protein [Vicinamibacterales bacterium]|nr:IPT/TIG domain-containing protein [Vicinamibacterales bacterium]